MGWKNWRRDLVWSYGSVTMEERAWIELYRVSENEALSGFREEVRALEDPVPPEFVRGFQESTIYHPVPQQFLETAISESLKLPAHVWRDYLEQAVLSILILQGLATKRLTVVEADVDISAPAPARWVSTRRSA